MGISIFERECDLLLTSAEKTFLALLLLLPVALLGGGTQHALDRKAPVDAKAHGRAYAGGGPRAGQRELEAEIDEVKQSLNAAKQGLDEVKKSVDKATKTVTPYVDEYVPIVRKGVEEYTL